MKAFVVRVASFPADVLGFLVCLVWLIWGRMVVEHPPEVHLRGLTFAAQLKTGSWPARTWYRRWNATTIGHFIIFGAGRSTSVRTWRHELVHVDQAEACSVGASVLALVLLA